MSENEGEIRPMSDAVAAILAPTEQVDPDEADGTENTERIQFVSTGLIRLHIAGKRFRIRRPFLGEFRTLRTALQDLYDDLEDDRETVEAAGDRLKEQRDEITARYENPDDPLSAEDRKLLRQLQREDRKASRTFTDAADEKRLEWWAQVFAMLSLDGASLPTDVPTWLTDGNLPNRVVNHWRTVPLGRG